MYYLRDRGDRPDYEPSPPPRHQMVKTKKDSDYIYEATPSSLENYNYQETQQKEIGQYETKYDYYGGNNLIFTLSAV